MPNAMTIRRAKRAAAEKARREAFTPEQKAKILQDQRDRYANDPSVRFKVKTRVKARDNTWEDPSP